MKFASIIIAAAGFGLLAPGTGLANPATAADVAKEFCAHRVTGKAEDEQATMALLTPSLLAAMHEAQGKSDAWEAAHPGEKPPLGDGVPFQSYPDIAPECIPGPVSADGTTVDVEFRFPESEAANWTDRLKFATVDGRVLIDDVFYGVNEFQDSLRDSLASVGQPVTIED